MKTIKVTNVKMHKIANNLARSHSEMYTEVSVAEAKLVLVECSPDDALLYYSRTNKEYTTRYSDKAGYYKPILISETETIEVGDWALHVRPDLDPKIIQCNESNCFSIQEHWDKILSLPEHFSPRHLEAIVDGKMKDADKVLVETEETPDVHYARHTRADIQYERQIKLNSSNHITLHKVEEKMYTKEQVTCFLYGALGLASEQELMKFIDETVK